MQDAAQQCKESARRRTHAGVGRKLRRKTGKTETAGMGRVRKWVRTRSSETNVRVRLGERSGNGQRYEPGYFTDTRAGGTCCKPRHWASWMRGRCGREGWWKAGVARGGGRGGGRRGRRRGLEATRTSAAENHRRITTESQAVAAISLPRARAHARTRARHIQCAQRCGGGAREMPPPPCACACSGASGGGRDDVARPRLEHS